MDTTGPTLRLTQTPPRYLPEIWNVNQETLSDGMRTNNMCEAWNSALKKKSRKAHPTVWALIEALKADNVKDELFLTRQDQGLPDTTRINQKSKNLQKQLQKLCVKYRDGAHSLEDFLYNVGRTVRFSSATSSTDNNNNCWDDIFTSHPAVFTATNLLKDTFVFSQPFY